MPARIARQQRNRGRMILLRVEASDRPKQNHVARELQNGASFEPRFVADFWLEAVIDAYHAAREWWRHSRECRFGAGRVCNHFRIYSARRQEPLDRQNPKWELVPGGVQVRKN